MSDTTPIVGYRRKDGVLTITICAPIEHRKHGAELAEARAVFALLASFVARSDSLGGITIVLGATWAGFVRLWFVRRWRSIVRGVS